MRKSGRVKLAIALLFMGVMALHCGDPNIPTFVVISPAQNTVYIADYSAPLPVDVEVAVNQPGCGGTTYPIDPATFTATLQLWRDGELIAEEDRTSSFDEGVLDPSIARYTFTGNVELPGFGDWVILFNVSNAMGEGMGTLSLQVVQTVTEYGGGIYKMTVDGLDQDPNNCLLPDSLLPIIQGIVGGTWFGLTLPSGADILAAGNSHPLTIPLPYPLGNVEVLLSVDEADNAILIDGPDDYTIDLTGLVPAPFTGFDCVITAAADGIFDDLDPYDPDGSLTIAISDVQASPGGNCTLTAPTGACALIVDLDGSTF